jgi:hypothetical protein
MRVVTYKTIHDYFKTLGENHKTIETFVGYSPEELAVQMGKLKGFKTPMMVLFNYEGKLDGNQQRTFATRTISFAILKTVVKPDNFTEQYNAIAESEVLGLSVLSRINYDSKCKNVEWLHNNFLKESVRFNEIKFKGKEALFGMEFFFDLKTPEPLVIEENNWNDIGESN